MSNILDKSGQLFNTIMRRYGLKNDAALCGKLGVTPPAISKIRNGRNNVSAELILIIHEKLKMPVADIRVLLAMPATMEKEAA